MKTLLIKVLSKITLLISIILFVYFSYIILMYPLVGMIVIKVEDNFFEVIETHPVSWSNFVGIEEGHEVFLETDTDNSEKKIEMVKEIFLKLDEDFQIHKINYKDTSSGFIFISFLPLIVCLVNIFIAGFLLKKYSNRSIKLLALLFLNIGLTYLSASISARDNIVGLYVNSIGLLMCPVILLYFLNELNYEKEQSRVIQLKYVNLLWIASLTVGLIDVSLLGKDTNNGLILYTFSTLLLITAIPIIKLIKSLQNYINEYKLKLFYYGILVAFVPFIAFYIIPLLVLNQTIISAELTSLFFLAVPFIGVYIMLIDVLPDFDYQINRLKMACTRALIPSILISICTYIMVNTDWSFIKFWSLIIMNFILISILLFVIDPNYKLKEDFEESFLNLTVRGRSVKSTDSLIMNMTQEIEHRLEIPKVSHFIYHKRKNRFCINEEIKGLEGFNYEIQNHNSKLGVGQLFSTSFGYYLIIGMNFDELIVLYLPYKKGIIKYNKAEKYWLRTISMINQSILENLNNINDMVDGLEESLRNEDFDSLDSYKLFLLISERESKRISLDIHDSLLQELISLSRLIGEDVTDNKLLFIKERLLDQIKSLRDSCYELDPVFINKYDFVEAVNNLILTYRLRENMEFKLINNLKNYNLTEHQMICFYRIIQEMLVNAVKHSKANKVSISMTSQFNTIALEYHDDGVGLNMEKRSTSNRHFGLLSIKHRVRSMDGVITFSSSTNSGLSILIKIESFPENVEKREELF